MVPNVVSILFVAGAILLQTTTAETSCKEQYDSYRVCVKGKMGQDKNDPTASSNRRQKMESEIRTCFNQSGCHDPYPPPEERKKREECFKAANVEVRQALQWCVQSQTAKFQLPGDDNDRDAYWNFLLLRTFAAMRSIGDNSQNPNRRNRQKWQQAAPNQPPNDACGNDDQKKSAVMKCLKSKGTFNRTSANSNGRKNSCKIKEQCSQTSQGCQEEWNNNYKPRLCDCVNALQKNASLKNIQDNYIKCLRGKQLYVQDEPNDDGRLVVARFLNGWCPSRNASQSRYKGNNPCQKASSNSQQPSSSTNDDGTAVQQANPMDGFLGGNDLFAGLNNPFSSLLGGAQGGGGGGGPLGGALSSFGGGNSPFSSILGGLGGGGNSLGGLPGGLGGGSNLMGGALGGNPFAAFLGGGNLLSGAGLNAGPSLGALGGGGDLLSGLGGFNSLGALTSFGGKK